jgi:hypothetical protein
MGILTRDDTREFRRLVERLVDQCNREVAMRASADWRALRAHQWRLTQAIPSLRAALAIAAAGRVLSRIAAGEQSALALDGVTGRGMRPPLLCLRVHRC